MEAAHTAGCFGGHRHDDSVHLNISWIKRVSAVQLWGMISVCTSLQSITSRELKCWLHLFWTRWRWAAYQAMLRTAPSGRTTPSGQCEQTKNMGHCDVKRLLALSTKTQHLSLRGGLQPTVFVSRGCCFLRRQSWNAIHEASDSTLLFCSRVPTL